MLKTPKFIKELQENDWIELGGTLYQVEKPLEDNDYGDKVIHFRHDPSAAACFMMVTRPLLRVDVITQL